MQQYLASLTFCLLLLAQAVSATAGQPNVVVILVDDMGYGDIAAHGNPVVHTPNLDRLHAESARLTDFHVDPTCSPTRAALMTGKYSHHVKVWSTIAGGNHLGADELTMADAFRANGYRTGLFGKWHLGSNLPYRPIDRGFDEWLGKGDGGVGTTDDYFFNDRVNDHFIHNGERDQPIAGWEDEVFFNSAINFIRSSKKAKKPFFIYLPTYSVHHPVALPDPSWADDYKRKVDAGLAFFFASIEKVDAQIGRLRATLTEEGLDRDTIVIFMTDNGGTQGVKLFNAGMQGRKGSVYDGGHRVPCFVHWPAGGLRQGEDITSLNANIDMLPTLADLCGLKLPRNVDFDGRSFRAQLLDAKAEAPERTLFVELQRRFTAEKWRGAVGMTSRWRLIDNKLLYDIKADPEQKKNVIAERPDVVASIRQEFESYWAKVTPGDRDRPEFIVGDDRQMETFLSSSDWYIPTNPPWNHAEVADGLTASGDWIIRAAKTGTYRFEVRRWPREADAELAGVPAIHKTIDSWAFHGPNLDLIYGNARGTSFKKLPVASVRLTVDGKTQTLPAGPGAQEVSFDVQLTTDRSYSVKAELLDGTDKVITGGYYVYCHKTANDRQLGNK